MIALIIGLIAAYYLITKPLLVIGSLFVIGYYALQAIKIVALLAIPVVLLIMISGVV